MSRQRKKRKYLTPDLTPLIDVTFQLLIFFMISSSFIKLGDLEVIVPKSELSLPKEETVLTIILDRNGRTWWKKEAEPVEFAMEDLETVLAGAREVSVAADAELRYQSIIDLVSEIKKRGVPTLSLTVQK
jgi:biopolymer transport protein ExbD